MDDVIRRKLGTLRQDPVGSVKSNIRRNVCWLFNDWAKRRLRQKGVLDSLWEFLRSRPPNAIPPNFADLWFLYHSVIVRRPQVILEFGSGCSTVALAHALSDNQAHSAKNSGYLCSVEADQYWAKVNSGSMPNYLRKFCEVLYSPLVKMEYKGTLGFRHRDVPHVAPNFLYLDGPGLTPERQVAVDVLDIEAKLPNDFFMVVDGRKSNVTFLRKHLKRSYKFKERPLFNNSVFELVK